jgi:hypothetical protein
MTESAMYGKVRDFVVNHWGASVPLTKHDVGPEARGKGIKLSFGGIGVEPDIYGIVVSNSVELPLLGEGKQRMGGHEGTHAFAQALTYRNLGMLSFLFFPESEFKPEMRATFSTMCQMNGIGLLSVPAGKKPIDPAKDVVVELAGGHPTRVVKAIEDTLAEIKGASQRHLAHIYPSSLRDFLCLFSERTATHDALDGSFRKHWKSFVSVFQQRPYDPMVAKKVAAGTASVRQEYFEKLVGGALTLGLIAPTTGGYQLTDFGDHLRSTTAPEERFEVVVSKRVLRLFAFAVMREYEDVVLLVLRMLQDAGGPVSTRAFCLNPSCEEHRWQVKWHSTRGRRRCPACSRTKIEPGIWLRLSDTAAESGLFVTYPFIKFAKAVGLFESRVPKQWTEVFPDLVAARPSGAAINWKYLWLGEALGS